MATARRVRPKRGKVYSGIGRVEPRTPFATRLQARLVELNWTNNELAKRLDVAKQQVSRWTTGLMMPGSIYLVKLARALGVDVNYLMASDEEEPTR
jgi:transcriptional regulator with XRE-family HTH domain